MSIFDEPVVFRTTTVVISTSEEDEDAIDGKSIIDEIFVFALAGILRFLVSTDGSSILLSGTFGGENGGKYPMKTSTLVTTNSMKQYWLRKSVYIYLIS